MEAGGKLHGRPPWGAGFPGLSYPGVSRTQGGRLKVCRYSPPKCAKPELSPIPFNQIESTASGGETPSGSAVPGVDLNGPLMRGITRGRRTAPTDESSQSHV